jgi:hypothetical protein
MTLDTHEEDDDECREAKIAYRLKVQHLDPSAPTNLHQQSIKYGM